MTAELRARSHLANCGATVLSRILDLPVSNAADREVKLATRAGSSLTVASETVSYVQPQERRY